MNNNILPQASVFDSIQYAVSSRIEAEHAEKAYQQAVQREQLENENRFIERLEKQTSDNKSSQEQQIELLKKLLSKKETQLNNDKLQELRKELWKDGKLLDDLITVPSSVNFEEDIISKYWKTFENVIPEMFSEYISQKSGKPYSITSINKWISKQKPPGLYRRKSKK
ncbi:MAG: hypothetical protein FWG07_09980 [Treponema sp.]|nr:hypothetical protein [Treponema sp.]